MTLDADRLRRDATALLPDIIDLRRRLHRHPELGLQLPHTQRLLLDALDGLGLAIHTGSTCTSVVAELSGAATTGPGVADGAPDRIVLLRADMDALPITEDTGLEFTSEVDGAMHACGHDAHVAMLVGAARLLVARRDEFAGTVRFMFQPGEEGQGGAPLMLADGVGDGVSRAFAIHITANVPTGFVATRPGPLLASADEFEIVVRGRGGHASTPHFSNDPVPVACHLVTELQTWVTRRVDVFRPCVITVGQFHAGTANNVIPETVKLSGTVRAVDPVTRQAALDAIGSLATGVASTHDMTAEVRIMRGYPVTVNHTAETRSVLTIADTALGAGRGIEMPSPVMGAEDFSYVLEKVPGAMVFLGACPDDLEWTSAPANHSPHLRLHEATFADGAVLHAAVALEWLAAD